MIKKLRMKLIAVSMFSLFLVLVIIMGAVNILNYHGIVAEADKILSILEENNGTFPKKDDFHQLEREEQKKISPE